MKAALVVLLVTVALVFSVDTVHADPPVKATVKICKDGVLEPVCGTVCGAIKNLTLNGLLEAVGECV